MYQYNMIHYIIYIFHAKHLIILIGITIGMWGI